MCGAWRGPAAAQCICTCTCNAHAPCACNVCAARGRARHCTRGESSSRRCWCSRSSASATRRSGGTRGTTRGATLGGLAPTRPTWTRHAHCVCTALAPYAYRMHTHAPHALHTAHARAHAHARATCRAWAWSTCDMPCVGVEQAIRRGIDLIEKYSVAPTVDALEKLLNDRIASTPKAPSWRCHSSPPWPPGAASP